jgi:ATP-dependent DNA helicase PIF1
VESAKTFTRDADVQIIVCGDFFQLPPISRPGDPDYKFAFEGKAWPKVFPRDNMSGLTRVFRQKDDRFVELLERMRKGIVTETDRTAIKRCDRKVVYADGIEPVGL